MTETDFEIRDSKFETPGTPYALVVEDDRAWREIMSEILVDSGLAVNVASDLAGAMTCLGARSHRLAVIDLSLGGRDHHNQDGLEVLLAIRQRDPACVTILLTGYATVELAVTALTEYGAFTCLRKETFRRAQFQEIVRQALADPRGHWESPISKVQSPKSKFWIPDSSSDSPGSQEEGLVGRGKALLVEDDPGWRGILAELLVDGGFQVVACSSYGEALGYLRQDHYDVAVIDLSLASVGTEDKEVGYRLLEATRQAQVPSVVVSGSASVQDVDQVFAEQQVVAFLEKQSFSRQGFLQAVQRAQGAMPPASGLLDSLTAREREVLVWLVQGLTNKEMADRLVISPNTVKRHLKAIFSKLAVHNRAAATARALESGIRPT